MKLCYIATALALAISSAHANTISWGSPPDAALVDSHGDPLTESFIFELGTFGLGFTPTADNMHDWASNWKLFDRALLGDGFNIEKMNFTSVANLTSSNTSDSIYASSGNTFAPNEQAFIWAYNSTDLYSSTTEWALITGSTLGAPSDTTWKMPVPASQTGPTYYWRIDGLDPQDTNIIFGGVNGVVGPGNYSDNPPGFEFQTAVVPEPSSLWLTLGAATVLISVRRRRLASH